jgi:hypothetical protein
VEAGAKTGLSLSHKKVNIKTLYNMYIYIYIYMYIYIYTVNVQTDLSSDIKYGGYFCSVRISDHTDHMAAIFVSRTTDNWSGYRIKE